jgi:hypothetical protein
MATILEHPNFKKFKQSAVRHKATLDKIIEKEQTKAFNVLKDEFSITPKQKFLEDIEPRVKLILGKMKSAFNCPGNADKFFSVPTSYDNFTAKRQEISYYKMDNDETRLTMDEIAYVTQYCLMMCQQELMEQ